jgi:selenocysteine lyase/cysteine desulfurase
MLNRRTFLSASFTSVAAGTLASCRQDTAARRPELVVPTTPSDDAWTSVQAQFSNDPGVTYLNNASLGMPPAVVREAVCRGYELHSRDPIRAKAELREIIANRTMPNLATFFGASPEEISLTRNATEALHLAVTGLKLEGGAEVLITSQEHPAGRRPWRFLAARRDIDLKEVFIPSPLESAEQAIDLITGALTSRTQALAFCHVTRGGHLYPVKALCDMARDHDIATVVDGAQAVGMFPVDLNDLGCDAYAASLHKWMLAPIGTGMMYIRREARRRWQSVFDEVSTPEQPNYAPTGTEDLPVRAAIDAAVTFLQQIGIENIASRDRLLSDHLKSRLTAMPAATILSGPTPETSAPGSTIFELEGVDAVGAVAILEPEGLHIDEHARDGHNAIRISTHFYNTTEQIDRAVEALGELQ